MPCTALRRSPRPPWVGSGAVTDVLSSRPDLHPPRPRVRARCRPCAPTSRRSTRIPSVSLDAFDQAHVEASAEATAALLRAEGLEVEIVREGGRPAVIGHRRRARPGRARSCSTRTTTCSRPATTPCGTARRSSRPSATGGSTVAGPPTTRPGSWPTWRRCVPTPGRSRSGSRSSSRARRRSAPPSLPDDPRAARRDRLRADAIVLADSTNWAIGEPALTTTLRGMVRVVVTVTTLDHGVHSGMFGGAVPDALTALVRVLASLHDDDGKVAVAGLKVGGGGRPRLLRGAAARGVRAARRGLDDRVGVAAVADLDQAVDHDDRHRRTLRRDGVEHPRAQRVREDVDAARRPTRTSCEAFELLERHLLDHTPWGARVEVTLDERGRGLRRRRAGPGLRRGTRGLP